MNKIELLKLIGHQLPCAQNCQIEHECFGGFLNEEPACHEGIFSTKRLIEEKGYTTLIMTQRFFGISVFDSFSEQRPLPVIGTILIENGNFALRGE